jgi:hypothetical protein
MFMDIFNGKMLSLIIVALLTVRVIIKENKHKEISKLFKNTSWLVNLIIVIGFSVYMVNTAGNDEEGQKIKDAVKKGILAFIIAILAHLELTIAPFWIVFTLAVSFDGYV